MEYTLNRIASQLPEMPRLQGVYDFLDHAFNEVKKLPTTLRPKYVCRVMEKLFNATMCLLISIEMDPQVAFYNTPDPFLR